MAERGGIDASIPLQGKRPDTFGRISDLLGIQGQQIANQTARSQLQQTEQTTKQRFNLSQFPMDKLFGDDGTIDLNKIPGSGLREAAGDQYLETLSQLAGIKQQQIAAKQSLVQLGDAKRKSFSEMVGALGMDPDVQNDTAMGRQKVAQAFAQFPQMYPGSEDVLKAYAGPLQNAPPGKLNQVVRNIQLQATSASDQANRATPNYEQVNTGSTLKRVQTNPYADGGVTIPESMPLEIAPGQQSTLVNDQLGNQFDQRRDARGNIIGVRPMGGMAQFGPGERQSIEHQAETNFQNIDANRRAASAAPQQLDQIRKAKELSKSVSTGRWATDRASLESGISSFIPGFKDAANDATKVQLLEKFTERIAADSERILGTHAGTDAARESIHRMNANTGYTPQAIQEVLSYAEAQTMAMAGKGDAQEKWLKTEGNGIVKQHEFETAWRQAYDPKVFQLQAASPEERVAMVKKWSASERADIAAKRNALKALGALPDGR